MAKHASKSMTNALLKDRAKEHANETAGALDLNINKSGDTQKHYDVVKLSPYEYKRHRRAKDIFVRTIGRTSEALHKRAITKEEFAYLQKEGAKLVVRSFNMAVAVRAWDELFPQLLEIPGRISHGVPIRFQPMHDWMVPYSKKHGPQIVDEGIFFKGEPSGQ